MNFPFALADRLLPMYQASLAHIVPRARGIWYSEMFAFVVWCRAFRVNAVIESGVYLGQSSEIINHALPSITHVAIDHEWQREAFTRLQGSTLTLSGDARALLRKPFVDTGMTVAVLLDGPKGKDAIDLACNLLVRSQVVFVAIHDTYRLQDGAPSDARAEIEHRFSSRTERVWATDDLEFVTRYRVLDGSYYGLWLDERGNGKTPYTYVRDGVSTPMRSYGPTLTFLFSRDESSRE